ncbi:MAG TPA: type IV toxin-antitoxin system AbiEi family antitoxin [Bacteroidales bacterium]|nr:type IV toxin-antitoxin system AbiEi family antitoxin [Bacteroidales bacterium]
MSIAEYINELLSQEEYSFSWEELQKKSTKTKSSLINELSRLVDKKQVVNLRQGFYLIIPPRYSKIKTLPINLYIDKLFKYLGKDYYLGLYTAAKFYGASHQQIQKDYVIATLPSNHNIKKQNIVIDFFNISTWPSRNVIKKKSDAGYFNVSSPALTMADLIHHHPKIGGINRMLAILEELTEELKLDDINDLLLWYPYKSTIQRMGYFLELLSVDKVLINPFYNYFKNKKYFPVLLSPKKGQKAGRVDNKWKVDVNIDLDSDL